MAREATLGCTEEKRVRLAWRNLCHDRLRFGVTIVGVAFAVVLMVFQGSLLAGFLRAAGRVVDSTEADLWITARGVPCLDFSAPLPTRFREIALGVTGVRDVGRLVAGSAVWHKPKGTWTTVIVVGADPEVRGRLPFSGHLAHDRVDVPESVVVDRSSLASLEITRFETREDIEINDRQARVAGAASDFGTFLGSPYVFATYRDAHRYLGLDDETTTFLLVKLDDAADPKSVAAEIRRRIPEADVWERSEFASRSGEYWVLQTGAGGSFLTAALLGFLVGLVIVSQNIYATTMENLEEFATLKAIGAPNAYIRRVVLAQSLASGLVGATVGVLAIDPIVRAARGGIPWLFVPLWLSAAVFVMTLAMCALASVVSVRKALSADPATVFRA